MEEETGESIIAHQLESKVVRTKLEGSNGALRIRKDGPLDPARRGLVRPGDSEFPDFDCPVEGSRGDDRTKFWVCPAQF